MSTKTKSFKSVVMASGIALLVAMFCAFGMTAKANTSNAPTVSEAAPTYCWGTLRIVAGIAVCDGAAYNCTHPCVVAEPVPVPVLVAK
jgi:hypothetical protein